MGKQVKWTPPQEDTVVSNPQMTTPPGNKPSWTPPSDDVPVKKKDLPSSSASQEQSQPSDQPSKKNTFTSKLDELGREAEMFVPGSRLVTDLVRRVYSGVTDDIPMALTQSAEVAQSQLQPANAKEFVRAKKPIDFQKYVREKEGLKWYQPFEMDKYIDQYAEPFMMDNGMQDVLDRMKQRLPNVVERRQKVEQYVQEQKQESAEKLEGAIQDYRDIKSPSDLASYVGTMGGQAAYQIPFAIATRGASSLIQESAAIYDQQLTNLSEETGLSREEIIDQNLDSPAKGQAFAVLAAGLDAGAAGNILSVLRRGAKDGLLKTWLKSAAPEAITEPTQGVLEEMGAATGDKLEAAARAIKDPARINEALGGIIGGSAGVFGASPSQTVRALSEDLDPTDFDALAGKAEVIQDKVEQHQGDLDKGVTDNQSTAEVTDAQTTEVTPSEPTQGTETTVPETTPETESQIQSNTQVAEESVTPGTAQQEQQDVNQVQTQYIDTESNAISQRETETLSMGQSSRDSGTLVEGDTQRQEVAQESQAQQAQQDESTRRQEPGVVNFLTDQGVQQHNEQTVYVEPQYQEQASQIQEQEDAQVSRDGNDVVYNFTDGEGAQQEIRFPVADAPAVGSIPLEITKEGTVNIGSPITEIITEDGDNIRATDADIQTTQPDAEPTSRTGDVPVSDAVVPQISSPVDTTTQVDQPATEEVQAPTAGTSGQTTPPTVPPKQRSSQRPSKGATERTVWARIKNDPNISETIKQGISKEGKEYVPRSLKRVTTKEADAIIDAKGVEEAVKMYLDDNERLHPDVDTAIGIKLFDRLQSQDNFTDAVRVFEKLSIRGTELGQAVNAYKLMQGKTMLHVVNKSIQKARQKYKQKHEARFVETKREIDDINQKAVEEVLKSPKLKKAVQSEIKKGSVKKAIDFLEGLKVDTKGKALDAMYGITAAAWNTIITAVQKGLQAGLTISQAINKAVAKEKNPSFQRDEAIKYLDEQLKDYRVTLDPGKAIKAELAAEGKRLDDIIREHYTSVESTKKSLIDKLIKDGNVASDQAQAIADELSAEFDRLTRAAKEKALKRLLPKPSKNISPKARKDTMDFLIEQSNIGALSEDQYSDTISEKLGVPRLTEDQLKEIQSLTDKVQKAVGETAKSRAAQDVLNYVESLKGWNWLDAVQSIWYANILSGPTTWAVTNPFANLTNLITEASIDISQNPKEAGFILRRMATGLTRGLESAKDVLITGYNPYKGEDYKTESKPLLERIEFKGGKVNPLNWLKYVTRAIKAGDILFYHPLKEQRLAVLALQEARKKGHKSPTKEDMHNLYEQLIKEDYDAALDQANVEGFKGREARLRAHEILESMRPEYATKEAEGFAATATFNVKPVGTLGAIADGLNTFRRKVPALNYVVPFVNTIMNVANEYMNYNPVFGFTRVIKGSYGWDSDAKTYRRLTNEERARIAIKATVGSIAMMALYLMDDPEDEDSLIEITANGYGDRLKNYELERSGWRAYSIRVGDTWYSYKNTPLGFPMASIGFMKDATRYRKDPNITEEMEIAFMGSARFMMDMSTLSGLSDFFEMFSKENIGEYKSSFGKFTKYLEKTAKSVIIPNYFTQMSRLFQELTDEPIKRADEIGQTVYRDVPLLRDHLDNLYDAFGDPVVPKQIEKFIPLNAHKSPEDKEMFDFLRGKKLVVGVPSRNNVKPNGTPMTDEEYRKWSVAAAKRVKARLKREYKMYRTEKNREVVQRWFDQIKSEERRAAKEIVFGFY